MLNKSIIMGRLTRDPELRYTQSNTPVVAFSVAVERRFKSKDGDRETDFIDCVAWRQQAEFVQKWFQKGSMICVVGSIQTRTYTDKDNNNRKAVEVVVEEAYFADSKHENAQTGREQSNNTRQAQSAVKRAPSASQDNSFEGAYIEDDMDDSELPF